MIHVENADILDQTRRFLEVYKSGAAAPFLTSDYVRRAYAKLAERAAAEKLKRMQKQRGVELKSIYPYEVRIAKGIDDLERFDFKPARVLTINEPIQGPYGEMWFGETLDGVNIRWGYVNGDSRQIVTDALDDVTPHGFLGGATGQGKSVTLNAFIYGACLEYPPWELVISLADAKIVEFKNIAISHPMPHIETVAATSDTDYILSLLNLKIREMTRFNSMYTKAGSVLNTNIANIKDFRKATGLVIPRNVLIFDECTAMFNNAGKKADVLAARIDEFVRLGRNTGYHVFLASQEISSDLPAKTLANMALRGAMGCTPEISQKILGNSEAAKNLGLKGRLIVNKTRSDKDNSEHNVMVRVPFMPPDQVKEISGGVIAMGKSIGLPPHLRFFDGDSAMYEEDFVRFLDSLEVRDDRVVLGPPSFIIEHGEQCVQAPLTMRDNENIWVAANGENARIRALVLLKHNLLRFKDNKHVVMLADSVYQERGAVNEISENLVIQENTYEDSKFVILARKSIYRRILCVQADDIVFSSEPTDLETTDELFYSIVEKGSEMDTTTNRYRVRVYVSLLSSDKLLRAGFQIASMKFEDILIKMKMDVKHALELCSMSGCLNKKITAQSFSKLFLWVFGMERVIGIGRDSKSKYAEDLKKLLQDCTQVNVRFIIFSSPYDEVGLYKDYVGSYLLEDLTSRQTSRIGCSDDWPAKLPNNAMFKFSYAGEPATRMQKFLKFLLPGELPC